MRFAQIKNMLGKISTKFLQLHKIIDLPSPVNFECGVTVQIESDFQFNKLAFKKRVRFNNQTLIFLAAAATKSHFFIHGLLLKHAWPTKVNETKKQFSTIAFDSATSNSKS